MQVNVKTNILPRQARDKHREKLQKRDAFFLEDAATGSANCALMGLLASQQGARMMFGAIEKEADRCVGPPPFVAWKLMVLPRQARDKRERNCFETKKWVFVFVQQRTAARGGIWSSPLRRVSR